jgi:hypothetical protein
MKLDLPDFKSKTAHEHIELGKEGALRLLDAGRKWDLAPALQAGGAIIIPHLGINACGHQIAAAVHACLDSGSERVLVLGVLHALTDELQDARVRVANGADVTQEATWGVQGPGLNRREDWQDEFSLLNFLFLWQTEIKRRGIAGPELIVRYPYLAGGRPHSRLALRSRTSYATPSSLPRWIRSTTASAMASRRSRLFPSGRP